MKSLYPNDFSALYYDYVFLKGKDTFMKFYQVIKRILDFVLSLIGITILLPLFLILAFVIKMDSKGPILFKQKRFGKDKKHFNILKFRTMRTDTPSDMPTHMLQNPDSFITRSGKFLRKTSLDELPQIINILKGEMSIIGPRPALWNQYDLISERDKYGANDIFPGLTGWAQINGRDELPIHIKAELDGYYKIHLNFILDIKIFFMTISKVVFSKGIVEGNVQVKVYNKKNEEAEI
jgi:O-antigen biosynthesis protein WbqP